MLTDLTLPPFAFVEGSGHESGGNPLAHRTVILHVRSASVVEILEADKLILKSDSTVSYRFAYINAFGVKEHMIALLHFCTTLDAELDSSMIIEEVLKPAAEWYMEYACWEDENILNERI